MSIAPKGPEVWQAVKAQYGPVDQNLDVMARDIAEVLSSAG